MTLNPVTTSSCSVSIHYERIHVIDPITSHYWNAGAQKKKQKATGEKHETHGSRSDSVDSLSRAVDRVTVSDSSVPQASSSVSGVNQSVGDMGSVSSAGLEKKRKSPKIGGHKIRGSIYERLYSYQIEGLEFMLRLFDAEAKGCILADDMGLGKTIQTIVLLSTLMDENAIKSALIVAPTTLLVNWGKEFQVCTLSFVVQLTDEMQSEMVPRYRYLLVPHWDSKEATGAVADCSEARRCHFHDFRPASKSRAVHEFVS